MSVTELSTPLQPSTMNVAFRHILVATDFSQPSRRALCEALLLAAENNSELTIIHVLPGDRKPAEKFSEPDPEKIAIEKQMKALLDELKPQQKIGTLVKHGQVSTQVLSIIEEKGIDLLVIGTRGRGGIQKLALGSVAEELLRAAPCPVMTIGPNAEMPSAAHASGFHTILFATDFGKGSKKALPLALTLAKVQQAKLILLHMIPPIPSSSASLSAYAPATAAADEVAEWEGSYRTRSIQQLREWLPAETGLEQEPEYVVGTDFLAEGVLAASSKFKVDLIVMGANRAASARAAAHNPWAAVHEVVRDAECPVLTVVG